MSETRKQSFPRESSVLVRFGVFWIGSIWGTLTSSFLLSRHYVFDEWLSDWPLALFGTLLISFFPFATFEVAKWKCHSQTRIWIDLTIGFLLIIGTDLISFVLFNFLCSMIPTYRFRYPAICLFVVVPMTILAVQFVGKRANEDGVHQLRNVGN